MERDGQQYASLPVTKRSWPRRLLNRLEIGQAVFFAILLRIWQLFGGAITVYMMTRFFTREIQGFYGVFASLIALQSFFELGFNIVVVNICSHEWSSLRLSDRGEIEGDEAARSRLVSFGRLLFRWYGIASALFVVIVAIGGGLFIARKPDAGIAWQQPWLVLVAVSGLLLWTLPFNAVLEGCNQVVAVNRFRLIQAITASGSVWLVMSLGGGLWAAAAAASARLICEWSLMLIWFRRFFEPFFRAPTSAIIQWRDEVLPLQWRLAVGAVFGYFAYFIFVPVMWEYHGPIAAGQMHLTWTVVTAVQAAALAWVQTRAPLFGMLVQQGDHAELDRVFFRVGSLAVAAYIAAAALFWLLIWGLYAAGHQDATRLLGPTATAAFLGGVMVQVVIASLAFYVRAHKQEPFLIAGVLSNLAIGLLVWQLGSRFGATGAGLGLLAANLCITLPTHVYLWRRCRREHATQMAQ